MLRSGCCAGKRVVFAPCHCRLDYAGRTIGRKARVPAADAPPPAPAPQMDALRMLTRNVLNHDPVVCAAGISGCVGTPCGGCGAAAAMLQVDTLRMLTQT